MVQFLKDYFTKDRIVHFGLYFLFALVATLAGISTPWFVALLIIVMAIDITAIFGMTERE